MSAPRVTIRSVEYDAYIVTVSGMRAEREYVFTSEEHLLGFLPEVLKKLKDDTDGWLVEADKDPKMVLW